MLSRRWQYPGWALLIPGVVLAVVRFRYGVRLEVFDARVFALYSAFIETRTFTFMPNSLSEEVPGLLMLAGLLLLAFSRESDEDEAIGHLRLQCFVLAFQLNALVMVLAFLTVFGLGFVAVLSANLFSTLILHGVLFRLGLRRLRSTRAAAVAQ